MEYNKQNIPSANSISFRLLPETQEQNSSLDRKDSQQLEYSMSYILTPHKQTQDISINIAIQHQQNKQKTLVLPKISPIDKHNKHLNLHQKIQHCIEEAQKKGNYTHKYNLSLMPEQITPKIISKLHLPPATSRRCLSLPQRCQIVREQLPRKRSKTMINIGLISERRENYECLDVLKSKQNKKIETARSKNKQKQFISHACYKNWKEADFGDSLQMSFVAKKLTLCDNVSQYKKYLKKITQNRQTVQHPSPRYQELAVV